MLLNWNKALFLLYSQLPLPYDLANIASSTLNEIDNLESLHHFFCEPRHKKLTVKGPLLPGPAPAPAPAGKPPKQTTLAPRCQPVSGAGEVRPPPPVWGCRWHCGGESGQKVRRWPSARCGPQLHLAVLRAVVPRDWFWRLQDQQCFLIKFLRPLGKPERISSWSLVVGCLEACSAQVVLLPFKQVS